jgi:hypothetical protein
LPRALLFLLLVCEPRTPIVGVQCALVSITHHFLPFNGLSGEYALTLSDTCFLHAAQLVLANLL